MLAAAFEHRMPAPHQREVDVESVPAIILKRLWHEGCIKVVQLRQRLDCHLQRQEIVCRLQRIRIAEVNLILARSALVV